MQRNGHQPPPEVEPIPDSIRTSLMVGGTLWHFDEDIHVVVSKLETFLLGTEQTLWFTADSRPMALGRSVFETQDVRAAWVAWERKRASQVEPVTHPAVVNHVTTRR